MKTFQQFTAEAYLFLEKGMVMNEMPYQVYGSSDGKKENKIGKPVRSRKYADARAAELEDTHRETGGKYRSQYVEEFGEETIDEILMITPTTKKTATKSQSKPKRDPYGEDPSVTRKRLAAKVKKLKEEGEIDEGIGMTMANAIGNPPALSKRMKLKQALIINKIRSDAKKNKEKKYSGKAANATEEYDLSETSLNRVRSKSQKGGMAIMSAQRGDKSKKENKARSSQLEKDIRGAGLPGPTKVSGRYTENPGTSQEKKVGEKSHVVSSGKMGKRKFKKAIEKLGKKYDQDSVLIQRKPKGSATIKGTSKTSWPGKGKNVGVGKMNPGKTGEFDTKVKNKTFTYEAKIDDGLTKDEKQIARNKRAGITNNPYIGNKGGQDSYRREKHIFDRYEKKVKGEK